MSAVPEKGVVQLVGLVRSSPAEYAAVLEGFQADVAKDNGWLSLPPRRMEPIYADEEGAPHTVRIGDDSPVATPYPRPLVPIDPTAPEGGFIPLETGGGGYAGPAMGRVFATAANASGGYLPAGEREQPDDGMFAGLKDSIRAMATGLPQQMAQSVLKTALTNAFLGGGTAGMLGGAMGTLQNAVGGLIPGLLPAASALSGAMSGRSSATSGASAIVPGGCFPGGPSTGQMPAFSTSAALSQLGDQLLSQWQVEDSDSMGEQLAHHFANKWKEQIKDPGAAIEKLKGYFVGAVVPSIFPAVRLGDMDQAGDPVLAGSPTVFAEGVPLSRLGDPVKPPGVQIYMGAATVLTNGQMTARVTSASQAGPFAKGASTVFVNGVGGGAPPPPKSPPAPPKSEAKPNQAAAKQPAAKSKDAAPPLKSKDSAGANAPQPATVGQGGAPQKETPAESKPIAIGIGGTGSKEYRGTPGAVTEHVENMIKDYDTDENKKIYEDGPRSESSWMPDWLTGAVDTVYPTEPQEIENRAYERLREQLQLDPNAPIDMYGGSRGGHIVVNLADRINRDGVTIIQNGQPVTLHPTIRYMGLYDPVDMSLRYGNNDVMPRNVRQFTVIKAAESDPWYFYFNDDYYQKSRPLFNRMDITVQDPSVTRGETLYVKGTHAGILGAPGTGDKPHGFNFDNDVASSINSDKIIRDRAIGAGAPVEQKDRGDYDQPAPPDR